MTNTNNTTDTNQDSEDELQRELERLYRCIGYDIADGVDRKELWIREVGIVVEKLIRTEKLKLLAEVRERVIGEDILAYDTPDITPHLLDLMECQNQLRVEQRAELTKLEAEL
jgi:hypothetical protein